MYVCPIKVYCSITLRLVTWYVMDAVVSEVLRCSYAGAPVGPVEGGAFPGQLWDVVVVSAGLSAKKVYFPAELLKKRASVFEGVPIYLYRFDGRIHEHFDHLPDDLKRRFPMGIFANTAGVIQSATYTDSSPLDGRPAVVARAKIQDEDVAKLLLRNWNESRQNMPELSIDVSAVVERKQRDFPGGIGRMVRDMPSASSVDIVSRGAAGAGFARLAASMGGVFMRTRLHTLAKRLDLPVAAELEATDELSDAQAGEAMERIVAAYSASTVEEQNFARALILVRDRVKQGLIGEASDMLDRLIAGTAYAPEPKAADAKEETEVPVAEPEPQKESTETPEPATSASPETDTKPDPALGNEPDKEQESMAEIKTVEDLKAEHPDLVAGLEAELRTTWEQANEQTQEVERLKQSATEKDTEIKELQEANKALIATVDEHKAQDATREKQALVERLVQSSKLSKIEDEKLRETWLSKDFTERLTQSDEAAITKELAEREALYDTATATKPTPEHGLASSAADTAPTEKERVTQSKAREKDFLGMFSDGEASREDLAAEVKKLTEKLAALEGR